jgi:hypothetical protein
MLGGDLLTIHYAVEDGNWSKYQRDKVIEVATVIWQEPDCFKLPHSQCWQGIWHIPAG